MISEIGELLEEAQRSGLATSELGLCAQSRFFETSLLSWLEQHSFQPLKSRSNEGPISELTPQTREIASPLSLSTATGLDQQSMHTDGAHLRATPDFVQLLTATLETVRCRRPSSQPHYNSCRAAPYWTPSLQTFWSGWGCEPLSPPFLTGG